VNKKGGKKPVRKSPPFVWEEQGKEGIDKSKPNEMILEWEESLEGRRITSSTNIT